ncbi:hypothetical protein V6Z12_D12G042400 [Gossypium hirsutum]
MKISPNLISEINPQDARNNGRGNGMMQPRNNHGIATFPSRKKGVSSSRSLNRTINEFKLVLGKKRHTHGTSPRVIVETREHGRNKNEGRILIGMKKIWAGNVSRIVETHSFKEEEEEEEKEKKQKQKTYYTM